MLNLFLSRINHRDNVYTWLDPQELLKELPTNLRSHLILFSYAKLIRNIRLLKIDPNFTATICPYLKILTLRTDEMIYRQDDPSMESIFTMKSKQSFQSSIHSFLHYERSHLFDRRELYRIRKNISRKLLRRTRIGGVA